MNESVNESVNESMFVFYLSQIGIAALFLVCLFATFRHRHQDGARNVVILISAALFAWIFENLNVHNVTGRGTYHYNEKFWFFVDRVPLFIVLSWAIILWTAMQISASSTRSLRQRVCRDATLAVLLDLGFDATAIRHEFWTWHGVQFNEAWFGVPAGNFFGWLWVSLAFSYGTRVLDREISNLRTRNVLQLIVLPPLAFMGYRGIETLTNFVLITLGWNPQTPQTDALALWVFAFVFAGFLVMALWPAKAVTPNIEYSMRHETLFLSKATRLSFHVFAVGGLLVLPATTPFGAQQKPALIAVAGLFWLFDWLYIRALKSREVTRAATRAATRSVT